MRDLLKQYFGYEQFRLGQEKIIESVVAQKDTLVLMPTGGGKSLCYQLPALQFDGITLVVSPLIALMKDQVDSLRANGISAELINSSLSASEAVEVQNKLVNGGIKLLYVAPERITMSTFQQFLQTLPIRLIAIDEAHCVSSWGHDFRPDYLKLKQLRALFPTVSMVALTATATDRVQEDIIRYLELKDPNVFLSSFNRSNLTYEVVSKKGSFEKLLTLLNHHKNEPTIIYCFSRKDAEKLSYDLTAQGLNALPYHAGLNTEVRKDTQDKFIRDEISIIVATIAFGMGINKPDVRLVVHYDLPKTIEGYYQETGRAGRDGLPSVCVLFYSYGDKIKQDFFIDQLEDLEERKKAQIKLQHMIEFCELQTCRRLYLLNYFGEQMDIKNCKGCDICLVPRVEFDATEIVQKILSAIVRTGQRFGGGYISEVLRGTKSEKIQDRGHDQLSVYGILKDMSDEEIKHIIRTLLQRNFLIKSDSEYPTLSLSNTGTLFLKQRQSILLPKLIVEKFSKKVKRSGNLEYDQQLFEKLRKVRKEFADAKKVPPFVIFGDKSLQEMAYYMPQTSEDLSQISGVGAHKLSQFGKQFLDVIKEYRTSGDIQETITLPQKIKKESKRNSSTLQQTKAMILQKLSLQEIAKKRGFTQGTIIHHIEELINQGDPLDIDYLKPSQNNFQEITQAFEGTRDGLLSSVYQKLNGKYSYDDLRLLRLFLQNEDSSL